MNGEEPAEPVFAKGSSPAGNGPHAGADSSHGGELRALHIRCPHCHSPIELVDEGPLTDIDCPSCGSRFNLVSGQSTAAYHARGTSIASSLTFRVEGDPRDF